MDNTLLQVGHYRMSKTLGIGAFGKVKLGEHVITGNKVAIKILNRNRIRQLDMGEKVRREINILKLCTHPHIIRLYEVIDTPSDIFVVMEYVSGGELFDYIVAKGRLGADEARRFFHQIISGVEYCHFHQVVHRDLKPENLLLDEFNNIKLADFGLSNMMRDGDFLRTSCGSPNYAAPEVISGNLYAGPEVDVWSCGVILYALLCGSLPFDDESIPNLFKKIKSGMYTLPSHLSQPSRDLIPRMLVVDPMKRITIPEIRLHPWFQQKLPAYLRYPPEQMEKQERVIDDECIDQVCRSSFRGVTRKKVLDAVQRKNKRHDLRVAYEIILDTKQAKLRTQEIQRLFQHHESTPPTFSPQPRSGTASGMYTPPQGGPQTPGFSNKLAEEALHRLSKQQQGGSGMPPPTPPLGQAPNSTAASQAQAAQSASANKRRRWYLGIQSKKDPAHVMTEVYKALMQLGCDWTMISAFRIKCRWKPNALPHGVNFETPGRQGSFSANMQIQRRLSHAASFSRRMSDTSNSGMMDHDDEGMTPDFWPVDPATYDDNPLLHPDYTVVVGLNLYKVQQSIYLLDFQRVEGDAFSFMNLSALIITQLKTLSAASRQSQTMMMSQSGQMAGPPTRHVGGGMMEHPGMAGGGGAGGTGGGGP